jgi:hypothetical protein
MADSTKADSAPEQPMYSRTPGRDIFGKLDSSIPEVRVPHQVLLDAQARAAELGLDLSAFLRENLYASLYGPEHLASLYEQRSRRVLGKAGQAQASDAGAEVVGLPRFLHAEKRAQP